MTRSELKSELSRLCSLVRQIEVCRREYEIARNNMRPVDADSWSELKTSFKEEAAYIAQTIIDLSHS